MFRVHAASQHDSCTNVQNINLKKKKEEVFPSKLTKCR